MKNVKGLLIDYFNMFGDSKLKDIYDYFLKKYEINKNFEANIRAELQRYSSSSKRFLGKEDLFENKSRGVWGLKNSIYGIDDEDKEETKETMKKYYEGGKRTVTTVSNKTIRNSQLAKDYKEYFKKEHEGKIYCEICGQWEGIGDEMLDVHHKIKVSDYEKENKEYSTFEDVILLCPNCHRLIHIFENIDDVKEIYKR